MAETRWAAYEACPTCGVAAGAACTVVGKLDDAEYGERRIAHARRATVPRGGRRPTPARAKLTAQIIAMIEPSVRARIDILAEREGVSQGEVIRSIIAVGLPKVEEEAGRELVQP